MSKKEPKTENEREEKQLVTKESFCATCALFSFLILLVLFSGSLIFGKVGLVVRNFLTGVFGYLAYPFAFGALYFFVATLFGKRLIKNRRLFACVCFAAFFIALILHTAFTWKWELQNYLKQCFYAGEAFPKATVSGCFGGIFVYLFSLLTTKIGAVIFFSLFVFFFAYLSYLSIKNVSDTSGKQAERKENSSIFEIPLSQSDKDGQAVSANNAESEKFSAQDTGATYAQPAITQRPGVQLFEKSANDGKAFSPFGGSQVSRENAEDPYNIEDSRSFLFGASPAENYKRNLIFDPNAKVNNRNSFEQANGGAYMRSYSEAYEDSVNEGSRPTMIVNDHSSASYAPYDGQKDKKNIYSPDFTPEKPATPSTYTYEEPKDEKALNDPYSLSVKEETAEREERKAEEPGEYRRHDYMDLFSLSNPNVFGRQEDPSSFERSRSIEKENVFDEERRRGRDGANLFDDEKEERNMYTLRSDFSDTEMEEISTRGREDFLSRRASIKEEPKVNIPSPARVPEPPKPRIIRPYVRVRLDDLDCRDIEPTSNFEEVEQTKADIIATLEDFKVTGASIASVTFGPTVTRYNVALPRSISPQKVVSLDQSISISLHSSGVNVYPNYEDGVVSIEVPNKQRQFVQLGCMLSGDTFVNAKVSSIMFAMGKDVANRKIYGDLSKMIHMLVAGSSGSGKSVFLGSLIISLIYKYSPEELRLILIDPKKTEFVLYNGLPHLMINEIITDVNKTIQSLNWAIGEMNRRYGLFEKMSLAGTYVVNLDQYNAQAEKAERLPKIVIIIDELADLMLAAKKEIEARVQNLTQKARAAGIHLIVATQRPSTDVITGVIKSNLPTRIAFGVATDVDSRVILDQTGAQKLLGKGDFLYTMPGINTPVRVQSAFISPEESQKVVNFIKANNEAHFDEEATAYINNTHSVSGDDSSSDSGDNVDPMYIEALKYVILSGSASISMIQRKCSAGYNRAGKIIEWMEDMGYISPFDGAKARKVLITREQFESLYGPLE